MQNPVVETRRAFGFLFIFVSIAVGAGSILGEIAHINGVPTAYIALIWLASFAVVFGAGARRFRKVVPSIRSRMKSSLKWSTKAKAINGFCWAGPFAAIGAFPHLYQYLILLGIGLGNLSTYLFLKKYSGFGNREQFLVGIISLVGIPAALIIDSLFSANHQDIAVMVSRMLIAIAYATGGVYAFVGKGAGPVGFDPTTSGSLQ